MSNKSPNEREFEAFLNGEDSELARLYRRLPQAEPDARLDAAVLALARAAVEPQRVAALRHVPLQRRKPTWLVGLGSAAGVVLAAGIAWQMQGGFQSSPSDALRPDASSQAEEREVVAVTAIFPDEAPAAATPAPPAAPPAPVPPQLAKPAPAPPSPPAVAATPEPVRERASQLPLEPASPALESAQKRDEPRRKSEAYGVTQYTLPGGVAGRTPLPPPPAPAPAPAQREEAIESVTVTGSRTRRTDQETARAAAAPEKSLSAAAASASDPRPFPAPRQAAEVDSVERKAALAKGNRPVEFADDVGKDETTSPESVDKQRDHAAAGLGATTTPEGAGPGASNRSATLRNNARLEPEAWIKLIRDLLREQRRDEAIENLDLFRRKHPTFVLPEDLRKLH